MNREEFLKALNELKQMYNNKEMTQTEAEIWYNNLKFMSIERFRLILSEIYKNNKFMPTLADILQMHKQIPYQSQQKTEIKDLKHCNKCNNTGYVKYMKKIDGRDYMYMAVCDCGREQSYDGSKCSEPKNKSNYCIKSIKEIGITINNNKPTNTEIISSMNILKDSPLLSNMIKDKIRKEMILRRDNKCKN